MFKHNYTYADTWVYCTSRHETTHTTAVSHDSLFVVFFGGRTSSSTKNKMFYDCYACMHSCLLIFLSILTALHTYLIFKRLPHSARKQKANGGGVLNISLSVRGIFQIPADYYPAIIILLTITETWGMSGLALVNRHLFEMLNLSYTTFYPDEQRGSCVLNQKVW